MKSISLLNLGLRCILNKVDLPLSISIDVTYRCNLNCQHCYFKKQGFKNEISKEEWVEKIKQVKSIHRIVHCTWVGGEPLLRKEIIEECRKFFDFNWIITNGTIEIPNLKGCSFFVSIDGTKKYHEIIRGKKTYDKIKQNIMSSNSKIFLATVLNKKNYSCIDEMVKEWANTNVNGISFDFHTPTSKKDELFIPLNKRDEILDEMLELKKEYGDFILLSKKVVGLMKSDNYRNILGKNCIVKKTTICFDPTGKTKEPCVIGNVDCSMCGCIIPYWMSAVLDKDFETGKLFLRMIS